MLRIRCVRTNSILLSRRETLLARDDSDAADGSLDHATVDRDHLAGHIGGDLIHQRQRFRPGLRVIAERKPFGNCGFCGYFLHTPIIF